MTMLEAGLLTAIGVIWLLCRMNLKRVAGYALAWDVGLTAGLTFLFIGTYAGMVTGMLAGVIVSIFLTGVKRTVGSERLKLDRKADEAYPRVRWKETT
jgi:hypothetical protein